MKENIYSIRDSFIEDIESSFPKYIGKVLNMLDLSKASPEAKTLIKSELWDIFDTFKLKAEKYTTLMLDYYGELLEG